MPLIYIEENDDPINSSVVTEIQFNYVSRISVGRRVFNLQPIQVPKEFEIENGLTGMKSSVNIRLMKHLGLDSGKIKSVIFTSLFLIN
jgi:hypothetical protein